MPTVIDSLVLEFGLDPSKFTRGQREAIDELKKFQEQALRGGKDVEAQQRKAADSLASLKRSAIGVAAVFLGGMGIKEFVGHVTQLDAWTARSARTLDVSARELSAWQGAAEATGGTAAGITGTMQGLSGAVQQLILTGNAGFVPLFNQLGISLKKANGEFKTSAELLRDLSGAVEGMDPARARALLSMVPGMSEDSINLLLRGRAGLDQLLYSMRQVGGTTDASGEAAKRYQEELTKLDRAATNLGRTLFTYVAPALTAAATGISNLLSQMSKGTVGADRSWMGSAANRLTPWEKIAGGLELMLGMSSSREEYTKKVFMNAAKSRLAAGLRERAAGLRDGGELAVKPGAGAASAFTSAVSGALSGVPGIERVTSMNDAFHQSLGGQHPLGQAMDVTVKDENKAAQTAAAIRAALAAAGIDASVVDEYANPSARATGGHIHIGARGAALRGGAPGAGAAAAAITTNNRGGDTTTSSTHIGTIVIHAEGGSSSEIAGGIGPAVRRAAPFNNGLQ